MRTAHPKLEEIRKRLRMPHDPSTPRRYITPKGAGEASLPVSQQSQRVESEGDQPRRKSRGGDFDVARFKCRRSSHGPTESCEHG
jgi:hypothetical protein